MAQQGTVFGVTYNYTGYPMVRQAREMVRSGEIGEVRKVIVEYNQGWLATPRRKPAATSRPAGAPTPRQSGAAGAIGDIGSHAENLMATVTGLRDRAPVRRPRRAGAGPQRSTTTPTCCCASPTARAACSWRRRSTPACENDLRLRVTGTQGTLEWRQEQPSQLVHLPA